MPTSEEMLRNQAQYVTDRSWFIVFSIALIFGFVWTIVGESNLKIVYITIAFIFFLNAMIKMEMTSRKINAQDAH